MAKYHSDEFDPGAEIAALVGRQVVLPLLQRVAGDADHRLTLQLLVYVQDRLTRKADEIAAGDESLPLTAGEGRLRFRTAYLASRVLFCFDARFAGEVLTSSGFTGFHTAGEVFDGSVVKQRGWIGVYNDITWPGWLW